MASAMPSVIGAIEPKIKPTRKIENNCVALVESIRSLAELILSTSRTTPTTTTAIVQSRETETISRPIRW